MKNFAKMMILLLTATFSCMGNVVQASVTVNQTYQAICDCPTDYLQEDPCVCPDWCREWETICDPPRPVSEPPWCFLCPDL